MAFPIIGNLPFSFTKKVLPPVEKKDSTQALWNSNFPRTTEWNASNKDAKDHSQTIARRSANFQPSIWTYDYIQSLTNEYKV